MVKVQDTYNPVTGEYVKRISDWIELDGSRNWTVGDKRPDSYRLMLSNIFDGMMDNGDRANLHDYSSRKLWLGTNITSDYVIDVHNYNMFGTNLLFMYMGNNITGFNNSVPPTNAEAKAYFYGWKMANSDGTSPYYKSEVPYTPATWAEWTTGYGSRTKDSTGITIGDGVNSSAAAINTAFKVSTKYGFLFNVVTNTTTTLVLAGGGAGYPFGTQVPTVSIGYNKAIATSNPTIATNQLLLAMSAPNIIKLKDIRIFELPTGSQIEADFTNLSADELSAKYTFNGLCVKKWKKATDGTGLTSTLPTASYAGYTPYKMIYQLATPEISYLTPKTAIPLYDTNTIVETNTLADCKADMTVGYKLKSGATAVGGDITAPTPDYSSAVNSVSELGDKKGIVRSPNIVTNGNFANGTTGWIGDYATLTVQDGIAKILATSITTSRIRMIENPLNLTDKYYFKFKVRTNNPSNVNRIDVRYTSSVSTALSDTNWKTVSGVGVSLGAPLSIQAIQNTFDGTTYFEIDEIMVVNLTASFGAGNEPTKAQCDILFATWQDKASTQATLPTLRKIGTVADTYNPETGVLVQRIGKKVFDGTEAWGLGSGDGGWKVYGNTLPFYLDGGTVYNEKIVNSESLCNRFTTTAGAGIVTADTEQFSICHSTYITFRVSKDRAKTSAQFKAYLAEQLASGQPVTIYYPLKTPVVTTLTKTALPTYKPTTVIESDSTVKGNVSADYKLKANATPVAGDFIASPEAVNDIKDLGNSIDVVSSVGRRNLLKGSSSEWINLNLTTNDWFYQKGTDFKVKANTKYTFSIIVERVSNDSTPINLEFGVGTIGQFNLDTGAYNYGSINLFGKKISKTFTYNANDFKASNGAIYEYFSFRIRNSKVATSIRIKEFKLEESSSSSLHTSAPEDITYNTTTNGVYKTNILLANPLRSVGAVKDRLFKDSDGKWKVERNIGEKVFNGTEIWTNSPDVNWNKDTDYFQSEIYITGMKPLTDSTVVCNLLPQELLDVSYSAVKKKESISSHGSARVIVVLDRKRLSSATVGAVANWVGTNGLAIQYQLATPTYETLSQELQTDLDNIPTFPEHNYVYTVANDNLQPTLHVDYKKLSWLRSRLLVNSLKIYSRNLTDAEMIQNYKVEKERFGM